MEYERFLADHSLNAGEVLRHAIDMSGMTSYDLSKRTGIFPQRISDYINCRRRISAEVSLRIESALHIDYPGFFYRVQTNHDIYKIESDKRVMVAPDIARIMPIIFWDTKFDTIDWVQNSKYIIQRIFEYGDEPAIKEIIRFYGKDKVVRTLNEIPDTRLASRREHNASLYL